MTGLFLIAASISAGGGSVDAKGEIDSFVESREWAEREMMRDVMRQEMHILLLNSCKVFHIF